MPLPTMNQDSSKSSLDLTQLNTEELLALANRSVHRAIEVAQEPAVSALSVEEALHKDLESRIDELKKANERLQMRCDAESVIRESGIDELRRLRAESERHAAVVASKDAMVNELKGKVSELEAKAGDAEFSLNNACTRVDDLFIQRDMILESHAAEIAEKERAVAEKDAFIVDLRATNSNLQAEIAERARKRTALLASLQSLEEGMHEGAQTQIEGSASSPGALKRKLPFPTPSSESPDIGSSPELKEELSPATRSTSRAKPNSEASDAKISLNPRSMIENKSSEGNQSPERCDPSRDDEDDLTSLSPSSESESEEADRAPSGESDSDSNSDSESDTPLRKLRSRKTAAKSNTQQRIMTRSSDKVEPAKKRRRVGSDF